MTVIKFYNENGNVSVKVRDGIRPQVLNKVFSAVQEEFPEAVQNANGGISVPVAIDEKTNEVVYAHFEMTISTKDPMVKTERKKSTKKEKAAEVVIPNIFE